MFASFTSFLPSALQLHASPEKANVAPSSDFRPDNDDDDDENTNRTNSSPGQPSVNGLTPTGTVNTPVTATPARQSFDANQPRRQGTDDSANELTRTSTNRSDVSTSVYSGYSSVSSFSSVASTSTNASSQPGRRMIIPLYNLQAHNVMTNTIVDAGTDAKIAKFQKRGLEMIGLAMLSQLKFGRRIAYQMTLGDLPITAPSKGGYPIGTEYREYHPHIPHPYPSQAIGGLPEGSPSVDMPISATKKNIFGKLFKRKGYSASSSPDPSASPSLYSAASPSMSSPTPKPQNSEGSPSPIPPSLTSPVMSPDATTPTMPSTPNMYINSPQHLNADSPHHHRAPSAPVSSMSTPQDNHKLGLSEGNGETPTPRSKRQAPSFNLPGS
ncbi:hypothetical protein IMY05_C4789000100 [Salix suchowensis]|nr:hypothetical protein IMY05_C4789000100 [Salix suchowensis]